MSVDTANIINELFRIGSIVAAECAPRPSPTSWSIAVETARFRVLLTTRDGRSGAAAMSLRRGTPAACLCGSGPWELRRLSRRLRAREPVGDALDAWEAR